MTSRELEFRQGVCNGYFLSDTHFAIQVLSAFASEVFRIHPFQLARNVDRYTDRKEVLHVRFDGKSIVLSLAHFLEVLDFYDTKDAVLSYDYLASIA